MSDLMSFAEMADTIERLPEILRDFRRARDVSLRDVSAHTGIAISSLSRFESRDHMIGWAGIARILRWLDDPTQGEGAS